MKLSSAVNIIWWAADEKCGERSRYRSHFQKVPVVPLTERMKELLSLSLLYFYPLLQRNSWQLTGFSPTLALFLVYPSAPSSRSVPPTLAVLPFSPPNRLLTLCNLPSVPSIEIAQWSQSNVILYSGSACIYDAVLYRFHTEPLVPVACSDLTGLSRGYSACNACALLLSYNRSSFAAFKKCIKFIKET